MKVRIPLESATVLQAPGEREWTITSSKRERTAHLWSLFLSSSGMPSLPCGPKERWKGWAGDLPEVGAGQSPSDHLPVATQLEGRWKKKAFPLPACPRSSWQVPPSCCCRACFSLLMKEPASSPGFPWRLKTDSSPMVPGWNR